MLISSRSYAFAVFVGVAAVLLRWILDPVMGDAFPYITVFGAVAASVWVGGYRPGIVTALLGYLGCQWLFVPPRGALGLDRADNIVGLIAYAVTTGLIIAFGEMMRSAQRSEAEGREVLRVTLRSIGDAVITTNPRGDITDLNQVAEHLTGWPLADAVGKPLETVFRIVNELSEKPVESPVVRALRDGVVVGLANHTVLIRRDGEKCPIDDSAAPIRDERGRVSGCVLIFRDVTAQRGLEREQARQLMVARLLAAIVESSDDGIISKTLDGTIQSWNAAAERLFGYTAEEAIGRHISLVIPADRIAEEDEIINRLAAGRRVDHMETERVRADGRRIQISLTVSPIRDQSGTVVGASKIVRDITDRKRAEAELRALAEDLSETDRRKNEFLATLAHELRNPLAPISNAVQVLRRSTPGDVEAVESASELLERQVAQMARLVDDLLDMSRITRGRIELRREPVDLASVVRHAVEATRAQYRSMHHALTISQPEEPVTLHADPVRLAQVLGNLLNNACKFSDKGGHVWLTVESHDDEVVIRVRDNGIGMTPKEVPLVFDMFTQLDTSFERTRDGLGIGLTLVRTLVEMHGGSVSAHSEGRGRGSEFVVRLPKAEAAAEPANGATPTVPPKVPSRRILIVDDNEDGASSLAMLLHLSGHETFTANAGREAVADFERLRPDVALLDIGLPDINGFEVCRLIREQPHGKEVLLVAVTGWGQEEDRLRSREAGFDAHVVKPVDPDVIAQLLASPPSRDGAH